MIGTLIIAGQVHLKGERDAISGVLFEIDKNDSESMAALREFVRAHFGSRVRLTAEALPENTGQEQGRLA